MQENEHLLGVVQSAWKWRRTLIRLTLLTGVGTAVISLFFPNYYQATTIFYSASTDQLKPDLIFGGAAQRMEYYGNDNDNDRLLSLATSHEVLQFLIDSFHLYEHYRIEASGKKASFKVRERLLDLYEAQKNKFDALELTVEDKDPEIAAAMANAAREKINEIAQRLVKESQLKMIHTFEYSIGHEQRDLHNLNDSLQAARSRFGIINTAAQSEALSSQLTETRSNLIEDSTRLRALEKVTGINRDTIIFLGAAVQAKRSKLNALEQDLRQFNRGMNRVTEMEEQYNILSNQLTYDKERMKKIQSTYQADIPALLVVEQALAPVVKSRPRRSFLVIGTMAVVGLLSLVWILLQEAYRDVPWKKVLNDEPVKD